MRRQTLICKCKITGCWLKMQVGGLIILIIDQQNSLPHTDLIIFSIY